MMHTARQIVRFYGGPADGLERAVFVPSCARLLVLPDYPGARYAKPDEHGVAHYLGLQTK